MRELVPKTLIERQDVLVACQGRGRCGRERKIQLCGQARQGVLIHDIADRAASRTNQSPASRQERNSRPMHCWMIAGAFTRIENELCFGQSGLLGETRSCRCVSVGAGSPSEARAGCSIHSFVFLARVRALVLRRRDERLSNSHFRSPRRPRVYVWIVWISRLAVRIRMRHHSSWAVRNGRSAHMPALPWPNVWCHTSPPHGRCTLPCGKFNAESCNSGLIRVHGQPIGWIRASLRRYFCPGFFRTWTQWTLAFLTE